MMTKEIYNEWAAVAAMTMVRASEAHRIVNAYNALMPVERRGPICHTCADSLWTALQAVKKEFAKLAPPTCEACGQSHCTCLEEKPQKSEKPVKTKKGTSHGEAA